MADVNNEMIKAMEFDKKERRELFTYMSYRGVYNAFSYIVSADNILKKRYKKLVALTKAIMKQDIAAAIVIAKESYEEIAYSVSEFSKDIYDALNDDVCRLRKQYDDLVDIARSTVALYYQVSITMNGEMHCISVPEGEIINTIIDGFINSHPLITKFSQYLKLSCDDEDQTNANIDAILTNKDVIDGTNMDVIDGYHMTWAIGDNKYEMRVNKSGYHHCR